MENNYENNKNSPEQSGESGHVMSMLMDGDRVDVLRWSNINFLDMKRMLQLVDVDFIIRNVQNSSYRVGQLYWKLYAII